MAKLRDSKLPRVLLLLVNDFPNVLVPKGKQRNTNNNSYYYFYSANMPNHLLIDNNTTRHIITLNFISGSI